MGLNALYTLTRSNYPSFCTDKTIWARSKLTLVLSAFGSFAAMLAESIAAKELGKQVRKTSESVPTKVLLEVCSPVLAQAPWALALLAHCQNPCACFQR